MYYCLEKSQNIKMDYLKTTAEKNRFQGILEGTIKSPEYVI
jgi:hypothetical protein